MASVTGSPPPTTTRAAVSDAHPPAFPPPSKPWKLPRRRGFDYAADRVGGEGWDRSAYYQARLGSQLESWEVLPRRAVGMLDCCPDIYSERIKGKLEVRRLSRCGWRMCPTCARYLALNRVRDVRQVLPEVRKDFPTYAWIMVTLTVRNPPVDRLRSTVQAMNKGFAKMVRRKRFPAAGWLKAVEVTQGDGGPAECHPHFHVLLMVPSRYFKSDAYVSRAEWVSLWRESMRLDYDPVVDVRRVGRKEEPNGRGRPRVDYSPDAVWPAVVEALKYGVKPADLLPDRDWFLTVESETHRMRMFAVGGVLADYFKRYWRVKKQGLLSEDSAARAIADVAEIAGPLLDGPPEMFIRLLMLLPRWEVFSQWIDGTVRYSRPDPSTLS